MILVSFTKETKLKNLMPLSMSPKDKYTTQEATYGRLLIGKRLTNRRITQLRKLGWYGHGNLSLQRKEQVAKTRVKRQPKLNLLSDFGL